jgi:colanic acid biosynthesis glycosyl transferase WcaI
LKLLIVTQYFWPENFRINDLVTSLVERGHEVTVLTGKPNYPDGETFKEFLSTKSNYNNYNGAKIIRVPMLARGKGKTSLFLNYISYAVSASIFGVWALRKEKLDSIFTYQLSPITVGIPAIIIRAIKKIPLVFLVLDLWPESLEAVGVVRSKLILKCVGLLVSFIYARSDLILAQSKSFIPEIKKYVHIDSRIEYFPSWAESAITMQDVQPAPEIDSKMGVFKVMFAGNIGEAQDFPAILAAADRLRKYKKIQWLIIGDGRKADWVKEKISQMGLDEHVLMLGRYPVQRMPSFFQHADALLVTLKNEPIFSLTIPAKLQAYLAAKKPILGMLNGEGAEIIQRSGAGISCAAGDDKALAATVLKLYEMDAESRDALGRNGFEFGIKEFDRFKLINQLESWLKNLTYKHT